MANPVEILPLLLVALVLLSAGGADVQSIEIAVDGERTVTAIDDVLIVGGGTATVPDGQQLNGSLYVIGGELTIDGAIEGDVVQLAGDLTVGDGAAVTGELQSLGGQQTVAEGAAIAQRTDVPTGVTNQPSPLQQVLSLAVQVLVLAPIGWALARRNPALLRNVGRTVADHGLVSGTVGLLASATAVALVTFMAITVLLLPVSLLGIVLGVAVVAYAYLAFGYLVGRRLPLESAPLATAAGVATFVVAMAILGRIPVVGAVAQLVLVLTGIGAVLLSYFGLQAFEPVELPG